MSSVAIRSPEKEKISLFTQGFIAHTHHVIEITIFHYWKAFGGLLNGRLESFPVLGQMDTMGPCCLCHS